VSQNAVLTWIKHAGRRSHDFLFPIRRDAYVRVSQEGLHKRL